MTISLILIFIGIQSVLFNCIGRIDRIGSANKSIQLVNYWPDISLDIYKSKKKGRESYDDC